MIQAYSLTLAWGVASLPIAGTKTVPPMLHFPSSGYQSTYCHPARCHLCRYCCCYCCIATHAAKYGCCLLLPQLAFLIVGMLFLGILASTLLLPFSVLNQHLMNSRARLWPPVVLHPMSIVCAETTGKIYVVSWNLGLLFLSSEAWPVPPDTLSPALTVPTKTRTATLNP